MVLSTYPAKHLLSLQIYLLYESIYVENIFKKLLTANIVKQVVIKLLK